MSVGGTFAEYLAKYLIVTHGYQLGAPEEAAELAADCDYLLTRLDGYSVMMVAIIDGERSHGRHFTIPREKLADIGFAVKRYAGTVHGSKSPTSIQLIETSALPLPDTVRANMQAYFRRFTTETRIKPTLIDLSQKQVWSPGVWGGLSVHGREYRRLLQSPRENFTASSFQPPALNLNRRPYATWATLFLIALYYLDTMLVTGAGPGGFTVPQLLDMGALNRKLVLEGDWYRLLAMVFLHGGPLHIIMNGFMLLIAGAVLERLVGAAWYILIFIASGLCGALFSLALNAPEVTAVGASGAITGLVAAVFVCCRRLPLQMGRVKIQSNMAQVLALSIVPMFFATGLNIDFYSHLGGAVMGGLLGLLAYEFWPREQPQPGLRPLVLALCLAGFLAYGHAGQQVYQHVQSGDRFAVRLLPKEQLGEVRFAEFPIEQRLAEYPDDPRVHMISAMISLSRRQPQPAEQAVRTALSKTRILEYSFTPQLRYDLTALLAVTLAAQGKLTEARETATPEVCSKAAEQHTSILKRVGFCD